MSKKLNISEKVLNIVCDYWCKTIKNGDDHDNGDKSFAGFMASVLANSSTDAISDEKLKIFSDELKNQILKEAKRTPMDNVDLYCDYGPDYMLREAAEKAEINSLNFPWKCGTYIFENAVIECRPYNRTKNPTEKIIYCDRNYIVNKIRDIESNIKEINERFKSKDDRKIRIESYTEDLNYYKEFLKNMDAKGKTEYVRY